MNADDIELAKLIIARAIEKTEYGPCLPLRETLLKDAIKEVERLQAHTKTLRDVLTLFTECDAFAPPIGKQSQDDEEHDAERKDVIYRAALEALAKTRGEAH